MYSQIITPSQAAVTIQLPDEMFGKTVKLIAFEVAPNNCTVSPQKRTLRLQEIQSITKNIRLDLSNFTFNRDMANDYE